MIFSIPFIIFSNPEVDNIIIALLGFSFAITINAEAQNYVAILLGCNVKNGKRAFSFNPLTHLDLSSLACFVFLGFGWARDVDVDYEKSGVRLAVVRISGAAANFFFANIIASILYVLGNISSDLSDEKALNIVLIVNLSFFVCNLILPIPPFCLGKALAGLFFGRNFRKAERKIHIAGIAALAILFFLDYFLFDKVLSDNIGALTREAFLFVKN